MDKISCPICGKEFASSVIESHANKCLFFNESVKDEGTTLFKSVKDEGTTLFKNSSPINKTSNLKSINVKKANQVVVKRKNSLDQFSSQNFQKDEEDVNDDMLRKSVIFYYSI